MYFSMLERIIGTQRSLQTGVSCAKYLNTEASTGRGSGEKGRSWERESGRSAAGGGLKRTREARHKLEMSEKN